MIIVGGENVHGADVEAVLRSHPAITDAAAIGIPATGLREVLGEMIRAYLVSSEGETVLPDLKRHCHKCLPSYAIPHEWVVVDKLPRNASGKISGKELFESGPLINP
ncbi:hypothetical protein BVY04_00740 [bacterium M21]|nr:hypothetical protein BVY04_00740 [bacterium M21]